MEFSEVRYPIGVQSFEDLRRDGYVYVDKTGYIPKLLRNKYYFLGRPRRFGKSLLLSTLEAYFKGKSELFEGLEVSKYEKEWEEYPVVHIDFASMNGASIDLLIRDLLNSLGDIAKGYGVDIDIEGNTLERIFSVLIRSLHDNYNKKVVILIDEYDKGIIETLQDEARKEQAITALRPFFSVLKSHDRYIRFAFITGVSRFRNTTIFSGFNNPKDISMNAEYAAICGITKEELERTFAEGIEKMALKHGYTHEKTVETLLQKYDGYRFTRDTVYVCNPFSIVNALDDSELRNYWVMSGSSKILADYLRGSDFDLQGMTDSWVSETQLISPYSLENPLSLFFQTGYLTIREFDGAEFFKLGFPNQEVQSSLTELLIPVFVKSQTSGSIVQLRQRLSAAVHKGDVDTILDNSKR